MKAKKKKKNNKYTFIIIPDTTAKPRNWTVQRKYIMVLATLLLVLGVSSTIITYSYYNSQAEIKKVEQLKEEKAQKEAAIKLLGEEIAEIEKAQENIAVKQEEIKKLMGIETDNNDTPTPSRGGKGGDEEIKVVESERDVLKQVQRIKTYMATQDKELDELLAKVNNETSFFRSIPNQWPAEGDISSPYGWRNSPFGGRGQSFHDGIDIANNSGVEVVAAGDGTVTFSGWQKVYGKTIIIDHGFGYVSKYGHNSALLVEEGDVVKKGDPIARLGNTGLSTGPHLHFTVMKWGDTQDPLIYLP